MSYYDDSSLFLSPNGYKTSVLFAQKPMDANGQLAFTRSNDTATRIAENGLIEKVRTNLNLYSEQMDNAYYTKTTGTTVTANNAANPIDGALTADTINYDGTGTSGSYRIYSSPVLTSISGYEYTWSVWLRCATPTTFILNNNRASTSVNVTSTWQRFSVTGIGNGSSSIQTLIYSNSGNNSPFALEVFGQQVELGVMTAYIATTTAAVSVGPVANTPRINYLGGGCGKLLLEPQRTNSLTYSESFNNAAWSKTNLSVSANTTDTLDPSGYNGADKITDDTTNGAHQLFRFGIWSTTQQTLSIFAKAGTSSKVFIQNGSTGQGAYFDLSTESIVLGSGFTASIESYGNGWYRCIATHTASSSQTLLIGLFTGSSTTGYVGTGSYAYIWGAQLEAGAYPTSYIGPTLGASVTRGADAASKTGISSLIGQTEGTIFVEFNSSNVVGADNTVFGLSIGSALSRIIIYFGSSVNAQVRNAGVVQGTIIGPASTANTNYKCALAYKANDLAFYVNGVLAGTDTSATIPATSDVRFDGGAGANNCDVPISQALVFKTRLSNSELAQLTTI